ncbi:hypothetical protein [Pareuzebyella sediminis]|uniref:hypothetical protein n=1 Tax=Pareuzebyella sediminis TaxID=2607998 RepID=UPI0011EFE97D|nr:hypothetical protein [Pareuzebyella sediminis]
MKSKALVVFVVGLCLTYTYGQVSSGSDEVKIYSLNLDNRKLSETLPFDRSFPMDVISKDNKLADTLFLFRVVFERKDGETNRNYESFEVDRKGNGETQAKPLSLVRVKDSLYRTIVPPLDPDKIYEFMFEVKFSNDKLNSLLKVYSLLFCDDKKEECLVKYKEGQSIYDSQIKSIEKSLRNVPNLNTITTGLMDKNFMEFDTIVYPLFVSAFEELRLKLDANIDNKVSPDSLSNLKSISKAFKQSQIKNELMLFYDYFLDRESLNDLLRGYIQLEEVKKLEAYQVDLRIRALKSVITKLKELNHQLAELILVSDNQNVEGFRDRVKDYITVATLNVAVLEKASKELRKIVDAHYSHARTFSAETKGTGLKVKTGRTIVSDFGLVGFLPKNNRGEFEFLARPYTGINIYFGGGIDRDLKIREIEQRKFLNMVSLSIGITIGGIDEDGFTDFFNGLSPTIGANVRLAPRIRVGVGTLILREKNINPIISREPIEFAPYVNLSFDLELQQYLGQLITTVFK